MGFLICEKSNFVVGVISLINVPGRLSKKKKPTQLEHDEEMKRTHAYIHIE